MPSEQSPFDDGFDTLVKEQLEKWKVPGLSIAIIHGPNTYTKVIPQIHLTDQILTEYRHMERQSY
jgi:hypothetical protein